MVKEKRQTRKSVDQKVVSKKTITELVIASALSFSFFLVASQLDLNERWLNWAEQYENFEIDELPLSLGIASLPFAWFSRRRWHQLKKINAELAQAQASLLAEIDDRQQTEKVEASIRHELERNIAMQQHQAQQTLLLQEMGDLLMAAESTAEIFTIVTRSLQQIVPLFSGAIYEHRQGSLLLIEGWGELEPQAMKSSQSYSCWAIRRGVLFTEDCGSSHKLLCQNAQGSLQVICAPIITPRGIWGIIHLHQSAQIALDEREKILRDQDHQGIAKAITDNLGLHLQNL